MTTYTMTGPDGKDYSIDGPAGASQADVAAQMQAAHSTLTAPPGTMLAHSPMPSAATPVAPPQTAPASDGTMSGDIASALAKNPGTVYGAILPTATPPGGRTHLSLPDFVREPLQSVFGSAHKLDQGQVPTVQDVMPAVMAAVGSGIRAPTGAASAASSVADAVAPSARQSAVDLLRSEGIEPPIGAAAGDVAHTIEQKAESVPLIGGAVRRAEARANSQLNTAVYNRVLDPIGVDLPKDTVPGRDAIQFVNKSVHDAYDTALKDVSVPFTRSLDQSMGEVVNNATTMLPDRQSQLLAWVTKINNTFSANGGMLDGDKLKGLSSTLRQASQNLLHSSDAEARDLGMSVDQLDKALLQTTRETNPDAVPAINAADKAYTGLLRLNRAASYNGAAGTGGVFTPSNLVSAVSAAAPSRAAKAKGMAPMQDLSDAAAMVLKPTLPNSGTADRVLTPAIMVGSSLLHNPLAAAGAAGAWAGANALYSAPVNGAINALTRGGVPTINNLAANPTVRAMLPQVLNALLSKPPVPNSPHSH